MSLILPSTCEAKSYQDTQIRGIIGIVIRFQYFIEQYRATCVRRALYLSSDTLSVGAVWQGWENNRNIFDSLVHVRGRQFRPDSGILSYRYPTSCSKQQVSIGGPSRGPDY